MYKAAYKDKHDMDVYLPSEKRQLARSMNVDHWKKWILKEIKWFEFQGNLEHVVFHTKGDNRFFIDS